MSPVEDTWGVGCAALGVMPSGVVESPTGTGTGRSSSVGRRGGGKADGGGGPHLPLGEGEQSVSTHVKVVEPREGGVGQGARGGGPNEGGEEPGGCWVGEIPLLSALGLEGSSDATGNDGMGEGGGVGGPGGSVEGCKGTWLRGALLKAGAAE